MPYKGKVLDVTTALYHHDEEQERPGYSLQELIRISRADNIQQRCTALSIIANIFSKSRTGCYDDVLSPAPLSTLNEKHIYIHLRFSVEDKTVPVVQEALCALKEFLVSQADEHFLDRLFGLMDDFEEPTLVPEIEEGEDVDEMKDEQLGQVDTIALVVRSNIVQKMWLVYKNFKTRLNKL